MFFLASIFHLETSFVIVNIISVYYRAEETFISIYQSSVDIE